MKKELKNRTEEKSEMVIEMTVILKCNFELRLLIGCKILNMFD